MNGFKNTFLSNFWRVDITYDGVIYPSVENFYQAMKTKDKAKRQVFTKITAADAKKRGESLVLRENWHNLKTVVMTYGIRAKFAPGSDLASKLLNTGNDELVEYNYWHDNFWGDCTCQKCASIKGENTLGKIIMQIRNELRDKTTTTPTKGDTMKIEDLTILNGKFVIAGTGTRQLINEPQTYRHKVLNYLVELLEAAKKKHGPENVVVISGMAEGFDEALARAAVIAGVPFIAAAPNKGYVQYYWGPTDPNKPKKGSRTGKSRLNSGMDLLAKATKVVNVCKDLYENGEHANYIRNKWMADRASVVWVYNPNKDGGTQHCVDHCNKTQRPMFNIIVDKDDDGGETTPPDNPKPTPPGADPKLPKKEEGMKKAEQPQNNKPIIETDNKKETKVSKKPISVDKWATDIGLSVELKRSDDHYQKEAGRAWFAVVEGKVVYPKKEDGVIDELTARLWLNRKGLAEMPEIKTPEVKPMEKKEKVNMTTHINPNAKCITLANGVTLNEEQSAAYDAIVNGKDNMLLTGNAGTGKSFVLQQAIEELNRNDREIVVSATTGIAATHIGGKTYHSALRLFPGQDHMRTVASMEDNRIWKRRMKDVELIIIDEVSMMHKDDFERLDHAFRAVFDSTKPFGGKRLCLVGDFLQVEPVDKVNKNGSNFVFLTETWQNSGFVIHQLTKVVRQQDAVDAGFLNNIRRGIVSRKMKPIVSELMAKEKPTSGVVHLVPTNNEADRINEKRMQELEGPIFTYKAEDKNPNMYNPATKSWVENTTYWDKNTLVPRVLELKVGATVINLINNRANGLVNGDIGVVETLHNNAVLVNFNRLGAIWVERKKFHQGNEDTEYRLQIPLKPAWAITIHKSQGMTLDSVIVSSASVFTDGQCYVALSRVRSLSGLYLNSFEFDAVTANEKALEFYGLRGNLRGEQAEAECSIPDENDNDDPNGGGGIDPVNPAPNDNDGGTEFTVLIHEEDSDEGGNNENFTPNNPQEVPTVTTQQVVEQIVENLNEMIESSSVTPENIQSGTPDPINICTGGNMFREYLVESSIYTTAWFGMPSAPMPTNAVFRVVTNDPDYWFPLYGITVREIVDRGSYDYVLLNHLYGGESTFVSIVGKRVYDDVNHRDINNALFVSSNKDANISFAYGDFDSQTIIRLKEYNNASRYEDMSLRGVHVANSSKMVKRLVELVKAVSGNRITTNNSKKLRIKVITHAELLRAFPDLLTEERAGKVMDGISIMSKYVVHQIYKESSNLHARHKKSILREIEEGTLVNHTLRILTNVNGKPGLIKGNVITNTGKVINARMRELGFIGDGEHYDVFTSVDNFKPELGTDGSFEFISLEPHHGPGAIKTNDQMWAQYLGMEGMLKPEEILHAFQVGMDKACADLQEGKDLHMFKNLQEEHASSEADNLNRVRTNINTSLSVRMMDAIASVGLDIGVSQTLMFHRINFLKKMFLAQDRAKGTNWQAPASEKKAFMFEPWGYNAYIMTKELVYMAGYEVDIVNQEAMYHAPTMTFMIPGSVVLDCMSILGGGDFDDNVGVRIRKMKMKDGSLRLVAVLVRTPNDWAEYYIIDVDIDNYGPVFYAWDEIEMPTINEADFAKFNVTSVAGRLPSAVNGSARPNPTVWDWTCTVYNAGIAGIAGSSVGGQVKTKMIRYATENAPFATLPCANEDMIDAFQQCKGDIHDIALLNNWAESATGQVLNGRPMDAYWWYSRNMYNTAKGLKKRNIISGWTRPMPDYRSPMVRDVMAPREEIVHETYDRMIEIINSNILEIPELENIFKDFPVQSRTVFGDEMRFRESVAKLRKMFNDYLPAYNNEPNPELKKQIFSDHMDFCAREISRKFNEYIAKTSIEEFYIYILKLARASWILKDMFLKKGMDSKRSYDRWLYTPCATDDIIVTEHFRDAIIWYRQHKAQ